MIVFIYVSVFIRYIYFFLCNQFFIIAIDSYNFAENEEAYNVGIILKIIENFYERSLCSCLYVCFYLMVDHHHHDDDHHNCFTLYHHYNYTYIEYNRSIDWKERDSYSSVKIMQIVYRIKKKNNNNKNCSFLLLL